jgi:hypothetical protein
MSMTELFAPQGTKVHEALSHLAHLNAATHYSVLRCAA